MLFATTYLLPNSTGGNNEDRMNVTPADPIRDAQLRRWRAHTPAADAGRIHLNNAGASLMPTPVIEAVRDHLELEATMGGYEAADAVRADIRDTYDTIAELIGAAARNIAIVENATVAFAQALSAFDFESGDTLLTT